MRLQSSKDDFRRYARVVGETLGSIQIDLMAPVLKEYPDLDPDM